MPKCVFDQNDTGTGVLIHYKQEGEVRHALLAVHSTYWTLFPSEEHPS